MCLLANINRDPKKRRDPYTPDDFNPMADRTKRSEEPVMRAGVEIFKRLFIDKPGGG